MFWNFITISRRPPGRRATVTKKQTRTSSSQWTFRHLAGWGCLSVKDLSNFSEPLTHTDTHAQTPTPPPPPRESCMQKMLHTLQVYSYNHQTISILTRVCIFFQSRFKLCWSVEFLIEWSTGPWKRPALLWPSCSQFRFESDTKATPHILCHLKSLGRHSEMPAAMIGSVERSGFE